MHIFIILYLAGLARTRKPVPHKRPHSKWPPTTSPESVSSIAALPTFVEKVPPTCATNTYSINTRDFGNAVDLATAFDITTTVAWDAYTLDPPTSAVSTFGGFIDELHRPVQTPYPKRRCNNYYSLCRRRYSNVTEVGAHNSPFHLPHSLASNQAVGVTQQLDDGIRLLQGQVHYVNGTLFYCHTSCQIQNGGPVEDYLRKVTRWLEKNENEVISIIFSNRNYERRYFDGTPVVSAKTFVEPIVKSGLIKYIYHPPRSSMTLHDWPTIGSMIQYKQRVVTFIDYNADTEAVPWLLPQFASMWETPFSQTNNSFPCTLDRPRNINFQKQKEMIYMANHNLNIPLTIMGINALIPANAVLAYTNGIQGKGSLGLMTRACTAIYGRPPNFLLVDYYGHGPSHGVPSYDVGHPFNGSVFYVAAEANGEVYQRKCFAQPNGANTIDIGTIFPMLLWTMALVAMF